MSIRNQIRQQFTGRRHSLQQHAREAETTLEEGKAVVQKWGIARKRLDQEIIQGAQGWLDEIALTETSPHGLRELKAEMEQWQALTDDERVKQVDAENGRLWRQLQAMRAKRGLRDMGRFLRGNGDKDGDASG